LRLSWDCALERRETRQYAPNRFNKVCDGRHRRVRGLWQRNGVSYAQVQVRSWVSSVPLEHCHTVASATDALQDLKSKIPAGSFLPHRRQETAQPLIAPVAPASSTRAPKTPPIAFFRLPAVVICRAGTFFLYMWALPAQNAPTEVNQPMRMC